MGNMGRREEMLIHMEELENASAAASEKWVWRKCNEMKSDKRLEKLKSYEKATVRTTDSTRTKKKAF